MRLTMIGRFLGGTAALALLAATSQAGLLAGDSFNYTGALTDHGWVAHSGAGNKVIMANGSTATLEESGGSGEDINKSFATQGATDKTYGSMLVNVQSGGADPVGDFPLDGNGLYFAHFKDSGFGYRARVLVAQPVAGGDFTFGISADTGNLPDGTAFSSDFSYDTWYKLVFSYDAATGGSELWVDPVDESSPKITDASTSTGTLIEAIALRQSNDYTGFIEIDNVGAGTTFMDSMVPEPASIALASLAVLGLVGMGRRRRG